MVPTWKRELDALVEETMAFAASVTEKKLVQPKQVDPLVADTMASEGGAKDEVVQGDLPVLATVEAVLAQALITPSPPSEDINVWPPKLPPMMLSATRSSNGWQTSGLIS
jgi:hypothetical protein